MKDRFFFQAIPLGVLLLLASGQARTFEEIRASQVLRVATPGDIPGFSLVDGERTLGYDPELLEAVAASLGLKVTYRVAPIAQFADLLNTDQIDVAIGALDITGNRTKKVDFTMPIACSGMSIVSRDPSIQKSTDLAGKTIALVTGTTEQRFVQKLQFKKRVNVYSTAKDMVISLASRTSDAAFVYTLMQLPLKRFVPQAPLQFSPELWRVPLGMMVQKGNNSVRLALNGAINRFLGSAAYLPLSQKYFGRDARCTASNK